MVHKTKGIILRTVKYGETSLIISMFTELFGLQSYLVNGIRQVSKKGASKATYFQPSALLELEAYHNDFKNLQRIREYRWAHIYQHLFSDVIKNAVALFIVELLGKCLKQPEPNPELFYFTEDALQHLDEGTEKVTANFPLYYALHLPHFFGFRIADEYGRGKTYLDLMEGSFVPERPEHPHYVQDWEAETISHILRIMQPHELEELALNQEGRRRLTQAVEEYYSLHIPEFGSLKTLPVLREVLS